MTIYEWIKQEEYNYQSKTVQLGDNWHWNMRDHIQTIFHLKNSKFTTGDNDYIRMFRQVMKPIIELANWTEDIDVKDVTFFIENELGKIKSFLLKKYHDEVFTRDYDLDSLFDFITESDNDYGGTLIEKGKDIPVGVNLTSIAFADQNDILSAPLGFKYIFSPDKLRSFKSRGWGGESNGATISIEDLIVLACNESTANADSHSKNESTGKIIEIYVIKGNLPEDYLLDNGNVEDVYNQRQVVAFYTDKDGKKCGVTLYRKKSPESDMMFMQTSPIDRRGLGSSVGEDLVMPQVFTNFLSIHKMNLIEAGSKVPLITDDENLAQANTIQDMENLEIKVIGEGKTITQVPTGALNNIQLISNQINELFEHTKFISSAYDPVMGKESSSGTTFRGQERLVAQGSGVHDRKRGKRAKFIELMYRQYIIPLMKTKIFSGKTFLSQLDNSELKWVTDNLAMAQANKKYSEMVFKKGKVVTDEQYKQLINTEKQNILKKGNKYLITLLENEFEDEEIKVGINISAKQKSLVDLSDKMLSIFQFIFNDPQKFKQAMQVPALAKSFEDILEFGGLSIGDFSSLLSPIENIPTKPVQQTQSNSQVMDLSKIMQSTQ